MADESEDSPTFVRQRRNVMAAGSILWALQIAKIDALSLLPNHASVGSPRNFELVWGILILYFMWRLYQVSHDFRAQRRNTFIQVVPSFLIGILLETSQVAAVRSDIREHYKDDPNVPEIKTISFRQDLTRLKEFVSGDVKYELTAIIEWSNGSKNAQQVEVVIEKWTWAWWQAALRAWWSLGFNTTYFTEYTLPYLIGTSGVALAFYRFWVGAR